MKDLVDGCRAAAWVSLFSSSKVLNISDVNEHLSQVAISLRTKPNFVLLAYPSSGILSCSCERVFDDQQTLYSTLWLLFFLNVHKSVAV